MQPAAQTTQTIAIESTPVVAAIAGGSSRTVFLRSSVNLDASSSYDPDSCVYTLDPASGMSVCSTGSSNRSLRFAWGCSIGGVTCMFKPDSNRAFLLATGATAVLDLSTLLAPSPATTEMIITVSVSRVSGGSFAQASITISISDVPIINVQIRPLYVTAGRCAYGASLDPGENAVIYSWSVISSGSNLGGFQANDRETFLAGSTGAAFVIKLDSPSATVLLSAAGASFTIKLKVSDPNTARTGRADFALAVPVPPSGGTCSAAPTRGIPLETPFEVRCLDWTSDNLPLFYSFSSRPAALSSPRDPSVSWSSPAASSSYELYLTNGNYSLAASISDAIGASTVVDAAKQVLVASNGSSQTSSSEIDTVHMSSLADSLSARGRVGVALTMFDGVAAGANADSPATAALCSSGGGCRRLLGSSLAYRMALRRLLLRKLGGMASGQVTATKSPMILRAARRMAAIPSELDHDGAVSGISSLATTLRTLDIKALRVPGALSDAVQLAARTLAATESESTEGELSDLTVQASVALVSMGKVYSAGMVSDEAPVEVQANGAGITESNSMRLILARGGICPGAIVQWQNNLPIVDDGDPSGIFERRYISVDAITARAVNTKTTVSPFGLVSLRLGTALGLPTAFSPSGTDASAQVSSNRACCTVGLDFCCSSSLSF